MQLINPIWLWGLTGLLIPIGIHLLSRKEGKVIRFGSLRHLEESHTKQSINVRLNEIALLILRCALIFLIVMLLGGLNINLFQSQKSQWMVLEEGLERDPAVVSLIDSLKQNGFEVKNMTKDFPSSSGPQTEPFDSYWEMIGQLPVETLDRVIIVSRNLSSKFRGKRIALPENVTWVSMEPQPTEFTLSRVKFSNDSVLVRAGESSALQTSFTNLREPEVRLKSSGEKEIRTTDPDTVHVAIYADNEFEYDRKIITAALRAIERTIPVIFDITASTREPKQHETDWIIWLSKEVFDKSATNVNSLVLREGTNANAPLLVNLTNKGDKQQWIITKRLNEETALQGQLVLNLSSLLSRNVLTELRADSLNQTAQPEQSLWSRDKRNITTASVRLDNTKTEQFLLIVIIIALIAERSVAFKRNA